MLVIPYPMWLNSWTSH